VFKILSIFGGIIATLGVAMYELLTQLRSQTFRADLPPWLSLSLGIIGLGFVLLVTGVAMPNRRMGTLDVKRASRYLGRTAILNTIAAALFSIPVLVPAFEFPILITRWPGIYMVIAYTFFIIVGVLGTFAWSAFYQWIPDLFSGEDVYRTLFFFQISAMEVGIYLMSGFMFLGGYVGSSLVDRGIGDVVVGAAMEFAVIPSALGIFLLIASALAGVANVLLSKKV